MPIKVGWRRNVLSNGGFKSADIWALWVSQIEEASKRDHFGQVFQNQLLTAPRLYKCKVSFYTYLSLVVLHSVTNTEYKIKACDCRLLLVNCNLTLWTYRKSFPQWLSLWSRMIYYWDLGLPQALVVPFTIPDAIHCLSFTLSHSLSPLPSLSPPRSKNGGCIVDRFGNITF